MLIETASRRLRATDTVAPTLIEASGFGERFDASVTAQRDAYNINSSLAVKEQAFDVSSDALFAITGQRLPNIYRAAPFAPRFMAPGFLNEAEAAAGYDRRVDELAQQYPDKADAIRAHKGVLAKAYARRNASVARSDALTQRSAQSFNVPMLGPVDPATLAGGVVGSLYDPATIAVNLAGGAAKGGSIVYQAARSALMNAGAEVATQPFVKSWADQAGANYTWGDAARQVVASAVIGGALDAGARVTARAIRGTPETVLDQAAKALPPDHPAAKAVDGDLQAAVQLAEATGLADDATVRGAKLDADLTVDARAAGVDESEGLQGLIDGLRHADNPDANPPPVARQLVPAARASNLSDDVSAPVKLGRTFEIDGRPVTFAEIDLKVTAVDAATFQFKRGGDSAGATDRLRGVGTWDPIAAGRAVVFERTDGTQVIADAHQRRALALRLPDQATTAQAFIFREADGWTPGDVRAIAAKKNLQEGSGTVIDAAAIMRERPDIIDSSVPLSSEAMRQARSVARLSDEAFKAVIAGVVPPNYAAVIGDLVPDTGRHAGMIDELASASPANVREARLFVSELMQLPVHVETQLTFFGLHRVERSLMAERVKVLDSALQTLKGDARLFAMLDREAGRIEAAGNTLSDTNGARASEAASVAQLIEQLATRAGPVSDWLSDAAKDFVSGVSAKRAGETFAGRVADALERDGLNALTRAEAPVRSSGFDKINGPEAQVQVTGLVKRLSAALAGADAAAIATPPPAPGLVRMYHGGAAGNGARWFTTNLEYAEGYAAKSNSPVWYVDVPDTHPAVTPEWPEQSVKQGFTFASELPAKTADLKQKYIKAVGDQTSPIAADLFDVTRAGDVRDVVTLCKDL